MCIKGQQIWKCVRVWCMLVRILLFKKQNRDGNKMRHGSSNNRRQRNRGGSRKNNNNQKTQVFDSNGPDVRIRGTAHQVAEKYVALAKDAQGAGGAVMYQNYMQHAEHYQRLINSWETDNNKKSFEISDTEFEENDGNSAKVESKKPAKKEDDDLGLPASLLGNEKEAELENS